MCRHSRGSTSGTQYFLIGQYFCFLRLWLHLTITFISLLLFQVSETDKDPKTSSEALGLAKNKLGDYEFIVAIVIWYEVLFAVNLVSKNLQTKDMLIDVAIE